MTTEAAQAAERRRLVDSARHSTAMEGGRSSDAARDLQERFVAGDIDSR